MRRIAAVHRNRNRENQRRSLGLQSYYNTLSIFHHQVLYALSLSSLITTHPSFLRILISIIANSRIGLKSFAFVSTRDFMVSNEMSNITYNADPVPR
jgi:hypothetical protein